MKKIQITTTNTITKYEAIDGEIFTDAEQCKIYEQTAKAILRAKFNKLVVSKQNAWELCGGYEDNDILAVKINSQKDADIVMQLYLIENSYLLEDCHIEHRKEYEAILEKAVKEKDILLMGINCDGDLYFVNTRNTFVDNLQALGNENNTKQQD